MNIKEDFDLKGIILGSVAGVVIALVIGLILFWLTLGTVQTFDTGIVSTGYTEISFIVGVLVASVLVGSKQKDMISAGISGFIIGLLTSLLEELVLKMFWDSMTVQFIIDWWGNPTVLLVFFGIIVSIGVNLFFTNKKVV